MHEQLKEDVFRANLNLVRYGLVTLTWGNVSGISDDRRAVVVKPRGVGYDRMHPEQMVVVDLEGNVIEGELAPSSDTLSHLALYRRFDRIGGITHTHSSQATMFAQARVEIPCFGTTHAGYFQGPVPVTRPLTAAEVGTDYETNTAGVIVERFADLDPMKIPAALVAGHGPFTWGSDAADSVENAVALEAVAKMAMGTMRLRADATQLESYVLDKQFQRKHV